MATDDVKAAPAAVEPPKAAPKAARAAAVAPVYATSRINGDTLPGDIFVPASAAERVELVDTLKAARDLSDEELALFEKLGGAASEDPLG